MAEEEQFSTIDGVCATNVALLAEYEAAQAHVGVINAVQWQATAIVLGGAIAGGAILATLDSRWENALALTVGSFGLVTVIELWYRIWIRHSASARAVLRRMRDIEQALGMRRNIYLYIIAQRNWGAIDEYINVLNDVERAKLRDKYNELPRPSARATIRLLAVTVEVLLVLLVAGRWLDVVL